MGLTAAENDCLDAIWCGQGIVDECPQASHQGVFLLSNYRCPEWVAGSVMKSTLLRLKGIKMRMPGLAEEFCAVVGMTAVALPGGEVFRPCSAGTIDATRVGWPFGLT